MTTPMTVYVVLRYDYPNDRPYNFGTGSPTPVLCGTFSSSKLANEYIEKNKVDPYRSSWCGPSDAAWKLGYDSVYDVLTSTMDS